MVGRTRPEACRRGGGLRVTGLLLLSGAGAALGERIPARVAVPAITAPGLLPLVEVDRAVAVEDIDDPVVVGGVSPHLDRDAAAAKSLREGLPVIIGNEQRDHPLPEPGLGLRVRYVDATVGMHRDRVVRDAG